MPDPGDRPPKRFPRASTMGGEARLGELIRYRKALALLCRSCNRTDSVDIGELADRVGYDMSIAGLRNRGRCERCGARPDFKIFD